VKKVTISVANYFQKKKSSCGENPKQEKSPSASKNLADYTLGKSTTTTSAETARAATAFASSEGEDYIYDLVDQSRAQHPNTSESATTTKMGKLKSSLTVIKLDGGYLNHVTRVCMDALLDEVEKREHAEFMAIHSNLSESSPNILNINGNFGIIRSSIRHIFIASR
jgi:hypothetical protein